MDLQEITKIENAIYKTHKMRKEQYIIQLTDNAFDMFTKTDILKICEWFFGVKYFKPYANWDSSAYPLIGVDIRPIGSIPDDNPYQGLLCGFSLGYLRRRINDHRMVLSFLDVCRLFNKNIQSNSKTLEKIENNLVSNNIYHKNSSLEEADL